MKHSHKLMSTTDHRHEHPENEDDSDLTLSMEIPTYIFDRQNQEEIPSDYNAVKIVLNATLQADLDWDKAHHAAREYTKMGLRLFWDIRLGLFDKLPQPIGSQSQFLSLSLSLEHFRDTLWKEFRKETIGICLYRGSADFSLGFPWDDEQRLNLQAWIRDHFKDAAALSDEIPGPVVEINAITEEFLHISSEGRQLLSLFCRDVAGEYLEMLARRLPDNLHCFVLLDGSAIADPQLLAQLTTKERFSGLYLGIKGDASFGGEIGWDSSGRPHGLISHTPFISIATVNAKYGICLPPMTQCTSKIWQGIGSAISLMAAKNIPFRFIPEYLLTTEWDGLDYIFVASNQLRQQGLRKLQGFCAAGGTVVTIGSPLDLANEVDIAELDF